MSVNADAASVIEGTLDAIAADGTASLVSSALRSAWNGRSFDEDVLRKALAELTQEEART